MMPEWTIFGGIAAVVVTLIIVAGVHESRRRKALAARADELGMSFQRDCDTLPIPDIQDMRLFNLGRARRGSNLMFGEYGGRKILLFDYRYRTGGGKNSSTHRVRVAGVQLSGPRIPVFLLRTEHAFNRLGAWLGMQDIDFEEAPNFSRRYVLKGQDAEQVRAFFAAGPLHNMPDVGRDVIEGNGEWLIRYKRGVLKAPELVQLIDGIAGLAPCFEVAAAPAVTHSEISPTKLSSAVPALDP